MMYRSSLAGLLIILASLFGVSSANATGPYVVGQCGNGSSIAPFSADASLATFSSNISTSNWVHVNQCGSTLRFGLEVSSKNQTYDQGDIARYKFTAPTGLGFTRATGWYDQSGGASPDWSSKVVLHNNGSNAISASMSGWLGDFELYPSAGQYRTNFEEYLKCLEPHCIGDQYHIKAEFSNIRLTVVDNVQPAVIYDGTLFGGGAISGTKSAHLTAVDTGSGVDSVLLLVNGEWAATSNTTCDSPVSGVYPTYRPCPYVYEKTWNLNTTETPFVNGTNHVASCTIDFYGNATCTPSATVVVNN